MSKIVRGVIVADKPVEDKLTMRQQIELDTKVFLMTGGKVEKEPSKEIKKTKFGYIFEFDYSKKFNKGKKR